MPLQVRVCVFGVQEEMKPLIPLNKMNKTESRFADQLEISKRAGDILDWRFEPLKFKIADKTYYTPDFMIIHRNYIEFVEIKGFLRDDAAVKFKAVMAMFPWFKWRMLRWKNKTDGWVTVMESKNQK